MNPRVSATHLSDQDEMALLAQPPPQLLLPICSFSITPGPRKDINMPL